MLVPVRTQSRGDGSRRIGSRERTAVRQREPRSPVTASSAASLASPASTIPPAQNEMYSQSVSFQR
jgi:hypothetical protein